MKQLDKNQLADLNDYLQDFLLRHAPLREELLDHLACLVEEQMTNGLDYPAAKKRALEYFTKDEVKRTAGKTRYFVHTKPVLMKIFSLLGIATAMALMALPFRQPEQNAQLLLPETATPQTMHSEMDPPDIAPITGLQEVTADFGPRIHPVLKKKMLHRGVDFKAPLGTPIVATADAVVEFAAEDGAYGLKIILRHDAQYKSLYAHLSEISVNPGQKIKKGAVIGLVGDSGVSRGPHLHYEIIKDGKAVNPASYLPKS